MLILIKGEIYNMEKRLTKEEYYLDMAEASAGRGTCLRRNYGAVIVKNDEVISTGYTGAPRGRKNCCDIGKCLRQELDIPSGQRYELCRSVHAEANAIISASRKDCIGATLYLVGLDAHLCYVKNADCCLMCKKMIINAGIEYVVIRDTCDDSHTVKVSSWVANDDSLHALKEAQKKKEEQVIERPIPKSDEIYLHFKNNKYKIIAVSEHTETGEKMVTYRALYGEYKDYTRPLKMFMSEVDKKKYPQIKQKYRFELIKE